MSKACALVLTLTLLDAAPLLAQVPPPPPPPPQGRDFGGPATQKTGTGQIGGRITALDTGRPLRRAVVRIFGPELRDGKSVSTDAEGRWELRELPPGRFNLSVSKGGYVTLSYGQRRPFESGKTIDLADAQVVRNIDMALPRGGAITGRVVDEFGDPVTGVSVVPMRYRFSGGQRRLVTTASADTTDDLGQYRLHGLSPGDYYLMARSTAFTFLGTSEDRSGYGQTYYPGTLNVAEATRVPVGVGQEASNIVIAMAPSRLVTLAGTATTSDGKPMAMGMVMLRNTAASSPTSVTPAMVRDGAWTMNGVVPGEYQLLVQYVGNLETVAQTGRAVTTEFATQNITVTGEDVKGLSLVTSAGGTLTGQVKFEGGPPPTVTSGMALQAMESADATFAMGGGGVFKPDWSFEIRGMAGKRVLRPIGLPSGWTLKSVSYDGNDITDTGIEVPAGQEYAGIEVLVTRNAAEISGTVTNAKGVSVEDYVVVLFPPESDKWGWQSRFVKVARPDQTGRFSITGVVPASYLAVAIEYLEPGEETNPEFLERLKGSGTAVRVAEGEKKALTLRLSGQQ